MPPLTFSPAECLAAYPSEFRPLLTPCLPQDRVTEWDQEAVHLTRMRDGVQASLPVCFLGRSAVGKSTLINALVAGSESLLPNTGVGPLTAQSLVVRAAPERALLI